MSIPITLLWKCPHPLLRNSVFSHTKTENVDLMAFNIVYFAFQSITIEIDKKSTSFIIWLGYYLFN